MGPCDSSVFTEFVSIIHKTKTDGEDIVIKKRNGGRTFGQYVPMNALKVGMEYCLFGSDTSPR